MPGASGFGDGFTIALPHAEALVPWHDGPVFDPLTQSFSVREHLGGPESLRVSEPSDIADRISHP